jgi:TPR repeat protein
MKRGVLGVVIVLASAQVVFTTGSPQTTADRVFTNPVFKWSVSCPEGWTVHAHDPAYVKMQAPEGSPSGLVGILSTELREDIRSLDTLADISIGAESRIAGFRMLSRRRTTLADGTPAVEIITVLGHGVVGKSRKLCTVSGKHAFCLNAETYEDSWSAVEHHFEQIFRSFTPRVGSAKARHPARLELKGLSVVPPAGRNWVRGDDGANPVHAEFHLRRGRVSTYFVRAGLRRVGDAPLHDAAAIVDYLKAFLAAYHRMENQRVTFAIETAAGAECASFDLQAEDASSPKLRGGVFEIDVRGLFCLHPTVPDVLVVVEYSRRTPRGRRHAADRSAGEEFIRSLKFTDIALTAREEYSIAMGYRSGEQANDARALYWFRRAAEQGYLPASTELCWHSEHGRGLPLEVAGAAQCYLRTAEQGEPKAQWRVALMYAFPDGTAADYAAAADWARKSAEQGHPSGQSLLAAFYRYGRGVPEDQNEAFKWLRLAAEGNYPADQYDLSRTYAEGTGTPRDLVQAYKWCSLAATQASERQQKYTAACAALAAQMTAAEVAEGLALARAWRKVCEAR